MKLKTLFAWLVILIVSFTPAILLVALGPGNYSSLSFTLGQMAGLIGMTMFALTFVLSTRSRFVEWCFDGLDKMLDAHRVLGETSLIVLFFHPLLLVMKYLPDKAKLAAAYILPGGFFSVDLGIYALFGMIILVVLTLYSTLSYQKWKVSHEFFGLVFLLAVLHTILIPIQGSRDFIFHGYYIYAYAVSAIGTIGFLYSIVLRRFVKSREYVVERIFRTNDCIEIEFKPLGAPLHAKPGQIVFVRFRNELTGRESHPFSVALLSDKHITIIAKKVGDFTSRLDHLKVGDGVTVEGPYGMFHAEPGFRDEVWVAGGIGITPFLGLAEKFRYAQHGNIDLYYSVKTPQEFIHLQHLKRVESANKRFRLHPWPSSEKGRLTLEHIEAECAPLHTKRYYLCGPEGLKQALRHALLEKGIIDVHDEAFAFK